jgi:hypothetical protein
MERIRTDLRLLAPPPPPGTFSWVLERAGGWAALVASDPALAEASARFGELCRPLDGRPDRPDPTAPGAFVRWCLAAAPGLAPALDRTVRELERVCRERGAWADFRRARELWGLPAGGEPPPAPVPGEDGERDAPPVPASQDGPGGGVPAPGPERPPLPYGLKELPPRPPLPPGEEDLWECVWEEDDDGMETTTEEAGGAAAAGDDDDGG